MISVGNHISTQKVLSPVSPDTTSDLKRLHVVGFSDSNYDGRGSTNQTIASGLLWIWNWNGSGPGWTEITNQVIANDGAYRSAWKRYAEDQAVLHPGYKVYMVIDAHGGSFLSDDGTTNNWASTTGTRRAAFYSQVDAALVNLHLTRPYRVLCNAMINDLRNSPVIATISAALDDAVTSLTTKWPGSSILWCVPGSDGTTRNDLKFRQGRDLVRQKQRTVTDFHIGAQAVNFEEASYKTSTGGLGDGLHYNNNGVDAIGIFNARFDSADGLNKYARSIINCHITALSAGHKATINTEIVAYGDNIYSYEYLFWSQETSAIDSALDYCFLTSPLNNGTTHNADDSRTSTGSTSVYWRSFFIPSQQSLYASVDDEFHGVCLKTVRSDASTLRAAFGCGVGTAQFVIGHTTTGVIYRCNDNALTAYATHVTLQNDSEYIALRSAASGTDAKQLWYNGAKVHSATTASVGQISQNIISGANNVSGAVSQAIDEDFRARFGGKHSAVNHANDYAARRARILAW
jgi:hypothetical protein